MAKLTKRMRVIREKVDATKQYDINEAIALLKELATAKFNESVDVAVNLGIDARKSDQNVRGATVLPHGTGRSVRVAVFTQGPNAEAAKAAGAELVGMEDLADQIKKGEMNFDVVIASPGCNARCWPTGPGSGSARPDAKPESRYRNAERC
ncbi:50S ribosomal protein L1 [Salmonella enterica subsp. enterica]|uniref:Large ribosomal subunit protein uL1 n=1 Tax=Salmonella enterica I TaxID=59201 RepID=A0A447PRH1_SALET|nr:50S ribosomal protein L1 [Salmonella enterica subsp. enterica]